MRLLILGYGRSGKAALNLAQHLGIQAVVADENEIPATDRMDGVEYLKFAPGIPFPNVDALIVSPGIHPASDFGKWTFSQPLPCWSELEFGARHSPVPLLAVTGTNGKTTTTELTVHILTHLGIDTRAAGNIGHALSQAVCDALESPVTPQCFVVEVSSFQLECTETFAPHAAVLLNVTSDHIDRYPNFNVYRDTKFNIFARAKHAFIPSAFATHFDTLFPRKTPVIFSVDAAPWQYDAQIIRYNGESVAQLPPTLPGLHNAQNLTAALMLVTSFVENWHTRLPDIQRAVNDFRMDAHRVELVAEIDGKRYVNDSKATNPDAVAKAVELYAGNHNIHLLLGGLDKGMDFSPLRNLSPHIARCYIYGQCAEKIHDALAGACNIERFTTLEEAIENALPRMTAREVLLLSPACASMDQFKDYRQRGDVFKELIFKKLKIQP